MKFLIILLMLLLVFMYKDKEGMVGDKEVLDYTAPVDKSNPIYKEMLGVIGEEREQELIQDLYMFNNVSNLFYGWQRMPTI